VKHIGAAIAFALMLAACSGQSSTSDAIAVGPNVQVSQANANLAHGEMLIAADPVNPQHLIACSGVWTLDSGIWPKPGIRVVAYVTSDGGGSWQQTYFSRVGAFDLDPVCAVGFNGLAFFGGASSFDPKPGHDWLVRSTDGGLHFSKPAIFPWGDRDFIAIDETRSAYRGRLYDVSLNATRATRGSPESDNLGMIRSTNGGATYLPSTIVFRNPLPFGANSGDYFSGPLAVLTNGDVITVAYNWPDSETPKKIAVFVSTDGGATFSKPRVVAMRAGSTLIGTKSFKEEGASVLPVIAADTSNGPFKNRIYVVWQDFAKSVFGAPSPAPEGAIMLSSSDDEGKTWSQPVEVDDAPAWPERQYPVVFSPAVAVNSQGIVAVTWYDARGIDDGMGGRLRVAVSNDGGETFSPSVPVADAPSLIVPNADRVRLEGDTAPGSTRMSTDLRYHVFGQDTVGLVADAAGNFHPLWDDNRTGVAQLWTASIAVSERAVVHGDPSLSHLKDVSKQVALDIIDPMYDRQARDVTADLALVNTSHHPIAGPIRVRVTGLTSGIGQPEIEGSQNGIAGRGAIVTFSSQLGSAFAAGGRSQPISVVFHIADAHAVTSADVAVGALNYITIEYKAYAGGHP
jgi:hypothetical protein